MARNFIDRCFEAVAPVHAVRRSAARTALQFLNSGYGNYGANLTKKSMRGWEYHGGSSKEDIEDNIDVLRQRSRDAYMGVPVAASALKTLRTNVVAGGLMPAPQIDGAFLGLSAEQTEELQEKIIREFSLWADTPECDIVQSIITVIMSIASVVVPAVLAGISALAQGIGPILEGIKTVFDGLIAFITGVFTGNWSQAWEGVKQIFGGAFGALVGLLKTPVNAVIALINKAISGINGLGLDIPDWVPIIGGKSFHISIPEIPMLAKGGFTDGVSIAGEAGREAVISFQRGVRTQNIATWAQAGRMLGVSAEQALSAADGAELKPIDPGEGGGGGGSFTFAPNIVIQGNADADVLEEALRRAKEEFEAWYEQMMRKRARTAY